MNIRLLLPILLFTTFATFAQRKKHSNYPITLNRNNPSECGTPLPSPKIARQQEKLMQQFMQRGTSLASPVIIPIKAHIVRRSDGTGGIPVDTINSAIAVMNTKYASINMSFSLCSSIHYIDSDELYELDLNLSDNKVALNNVNDAINVYFVGTLSVGGALLNGISWFPSTNPAENRIVMWNDATSNRVTLAHEMGHYWNLYHTHETYLGAELVNGSNCSTAGDLVCDTPADPCCYFYNPATCTYTGTAKDTLGQSYNPMVNNLMSYYGLCRDIFTAGQYARIDAGYALRTSYMSSSSYNLACNTTTAAAPTNVTLTQAGCNIQLSWTDNADNEMGYIIEASTSPTGPFEAIGNISSNTTGFLDNRSLINGVTYYYRVIAANSKAIYSNVAQITFASTISCYCVPPALFCDEGDAITQVKIQKGESIIMDHSSICSNGGYSVDSTAVPTLEKGVTYTLSLSTLSTYPEGATAWIDFNKNGIFENSEIIFTKASAIWADTSGSFTVPLSAVAGQMRMRVKLTYDSSPDNPCENPEKSLGYGETEDYWINIPCGIDTTTAATRCGAGSVNLMASGCAGGTIQWYNTATGGTVVATGGTFATPSLSSQTIYYVACAPGSCSVNRLPVKATIVLTNISFTNPSEPAGTFFATQTITSNTDVATGTSYYAGKSITLSPGFKAGANEVFVASIQNISCP